MPAGENGKNMEWKKIIIIGRIWNKIPTETRLQKKSVVTFTLYRKVMKSCTVSCLKSPKKGWETLKTVL